MRSLAAIFLKDLKAQFFSFIAYVVITMFLLICGFFFASAMSYFSLLSFQVAMNPYFQGQGLNLTETVLNSLFFNASVIMLLMIPVLTMRSFAEEEKTGTMELLFTYPVSEIPLVLGKFLACLTTFLLMIVPTLAYLVLVKMVGGVFEGSVVFSGYAGVVLLGCAFISLGIFCSSLTENQTVAAIVSFGFLLIFWVVGWATDFASPAVSRLIQELSLLSHFEAFPRGVVEIRHVVYYLFFVTFFLTLTVWKLERRRWRP
jgi:ABC-2 type transport system permease protein